MLKSAATIIAIALAAHILLKFAFFAAPYRKRRAALDRAYGNGTSATSVSDAVSLAVVIIFAVVLFLRGAKPVSFIFGLWIGATLIQTYFHASTHRLGRGSRRPHRSPP